MYDRKQMLQILEFILNESTEEEIEIINQALQKRLNDLRQGPARLRIREMARKTAESVQKQVKYSDRFHTMMKDFIRRTIKEHEPDIPDDRLEEILNKSLPNQNIEEKGREADLPSEAVQSMIVQFIDYSLGRMTEEQKKQLMPKWYDRYWEVFSSRTRKLITDLLEGELEEDHFWAEIEKEPDE